MGVPLPGLLSVLLDPTAVLPFAEAPRSPQEEGSQSCRAPWGLQAVVVTFPVHGEHQPVILVTKTVGSIVKQRTWKHNSGEKMSLSPFSVPHERLPLPRFVLS